MTINLIKILELIAATIIGVVIIVWANENQSKNK